MWFLLAVACSGPEPSAPPPEGDADTDTDTDSDTDTDTDADSDVDCIASGTHGIEGPPVATGVGEHLTIGDIDGDGDDDAVGLAALGVEAGSLFARDLDGDGRAEVVSGWITDIVAWEEIPPCLGRDIRNYTAATVYTFDGTWQPAGVWTFDHRQFNCGGPIAFRIEAAGDDILVNDSAAGLWLLPPAIGDLDLDEAATLRVNRLGDSAGGDIDGDGLTDVVAVYDGVWLLAGDLGRVRVEDGERLWASGSRVSVGDADGDGRDDVLVDGLLIDGQGHELASGSGWAELVPDLDGDGTAEIADLNVGGATLWLGPVQGTDPPPTLSVVRPYLQALEAGDTDGDGGVEMLLQDGAGDVFSLVVCP